MSLLQYANEGNAAEISERLNRGELAVDANGDLYRPKAEEHIDQRDSNTVGERRIKAFQFDHPEVHSFYKEAAANLMEELNYAEKGGGNRQAQRARCRRRPVHPHEAVGE